MKQTPLEWNTLHLAQWWVQKFLKTLKPTKQTPIKVLTPILLIMNIHQQYLSTKVLKRKYTLWMSKRTSILILNKIHYVLA
jgi:hypothetical protein